MLLVELEYGVVVWEDVRQRAFLCINGGETQPGDGQRGCDWHEEVRYRNIIRVVRRVIQAWPRKHHPIYYDFGENIEKWLKG